MKAECLNWVVDFQNSSHFLNIVPVGIIGECDLCSSWNNHQKIQTFSEGEFIHRCVERGADTVHPE
jgi:hypothetical protein